MAGSQKIRSVLFYISLACFLIGLPFLLSFALGIVFDPATVTFTKTGLISLKTQPQGARIYLNGQLLKEKTPATIYELIPGKYKVRLELDKYYPWQDTVKVEAGKVVILDKIIFFLIRPDIEQLSQGDISGFSIDVRENNLYYLDADGRTLYKTDLSGRGLSEVGSLSSACIPLKGIKISPDTRKILCFSQERFEVSVINSRDDSLLPVSFTVSYRDRKINDIFWHSDSYHLIVVTTKNIEVLESRPQSVAVSLATLNGKNGGCYYDLNEDILYFEDSRRSEDGKIYNNLYRIDLSTRFSPFKELIKLKDEINEKQ